MCLCLTPLLTSFVSPFSVRWFFMQFTAAFFHVTGLLTIVAPQIVLVLRPKRIKLTRI
ncbi:hypothetical protein LguiA_011387 [Lonicera macranthoides]